MPRVAGAGVALTLPPGEDALALVALDAEVARLVGQVDREEEVRLTLVVDDLGTLLTGRAGGDDLRPREDVAGRRARVVVQDGDRRRRQVLGRDRGVDAGDGDVGGVTVAGLAAVAGPLPLRVVRVVGAGDRGSGRESGCGRGDQRHRGGGEPRAQPSGFPVDSWHQCLLWGMVGGRFSAGRGPVCVRLVRREWRHTT